MPSTLRIAYIAHSLRSDWNNGNAHFLRGLMRALSAAGHDVHILESEMPWSLQHLLEEPLGAESLAGFHAAYSDLNIETSPTLNNKDLWRNILSDRQVVVLHEWNDPDVAKLLLELREEFGYKLLFHDTHHRASSSPQQIELFGIPRFDGVLAFGETLRNIYLERIGIPNVWTFHEAADVTIFHPLEKSLQASDVIWIGNWGDGERSLEISEYLLQPAEQLPQIDFQVYGVRYPREGELALACSGVRYGGYLPNLEAPKAYASSRVCMHIPRRQYASLMKGIPTIRVFEALACGIPLISAPWEDTEKLFRPNDFLSVRSTDEAASAIKRLLDDSEYAEQQATRGLETVLERHTCDHRASQLTTICEEVLQ